MVIKKLLLSLPNKKYLYSFVSASLDYILIYRGSISSFPFLFGYWAFKKITLNRFDRFPISWTEQRGTTSTMRPQSLWNKCSMQRTERSNQLRLPIRLYRRSLQFLPTRMCYQHGLSSGSELCSKPLCWSLSWYMWHKREMSSHQSHSRLHLPRVIHWRSLRLLPTNSSDMYDKLKLP